MIFFVFVSHSDSTMKLICNPFSPDHISLHWTVGNGPWRNVLFCGWRLLFNPFMCAVFEKRFQLLKFTALTENKSFFLLFWAQEEAVEKKDGQMQLVGRLFSFFHQMPKQEQKKLFWTCEGNRNAQLKGLRWKWIRRKVKSSETSRDHFIFFNCLIRNEHFLVSLYFLVTLDKRHNINVFFFQWNFIKKSKTRSLNDSTEITWQKSPQNQNLISIRDFPVACKFHNQKQKTKRDKSAITVEAQMCFIAWPLREFASLN